MAISVHCEVDLKNTIPTEEKWVVIKSTYVKGQVTIELPKHITKELTFSISDLRNALKSISTAWGEE